MTCPMLMLVGNHDQVPNSTSSLSTPTSSMSNHDLTPHAHCWWRNHDQVDLGGNLHALSPLETAWPHRIHVDLGGNLHALSPLETAWPERIHVFTEPALFRGALWLPYRRSQDQLREALRAGVDYGVKAVMAHADVQTARFNYQAQSREGVPPNLFPPRMPVYTGHYHLPHTVDNTTITYVGSPYQVTASEAGERKRLHVLDAQDGWTLSHTIPINVGPRHHRANSSLDLAALCTSLGLSPISPAQGGLDGSTTGSDGDLDSALQGSSTSSTDSLSGDEHGLSEELGDMLRPGDRLKLSLVEGEMEDVESFQMELEKRGISVEPFLRPTPKGPCMDAAEEEMLQEYGHIRRAVLRPTA
eukprot:gene18190-24631_t